MERLTEKIDGGTTLAAVDGSAHEDSRGFVTGPAIDRFAAYENTGLEPEEITGPFDALKARLYDVEQLASYQKAEQEGRLVVLDNEERGRWVSEFQLERRRQDTKWGFPAFNTWCEWAAILQEEAGEVTRELNELNFGRGDMNHMIAEAIQVAATALSILEQREVARKYTAKVMDLRRQMESVEAALAERERKG